MDIEKLLASFQAVVDDAAKAQPLIDVASYLPEAQRRDTQSIAGGRGFVGVFLIWLVKRDLLSEAAASRWVDGTFETSLTAASAAIETAFHDAIWASDVKPSVEDFCRRYLTPSQGSYSDDFHAMFVEGTEAQSFLHVSLTPSDVEKMSAQIDRKFQLFASGASNWNEPIQASVGQLLSQQGPSSQTWNFGLWQSEIRHFDDAESSPPGKYRARMASYLRKIDEVEKLPSLQTASELVRTYIFHTDASIQSGVWRLLRVFDPSLVFKAILEHIQAIDRRTKWAPELVDVFDDDTADDKLREMESLLDLEGPETRSAFVKALQEAKRNGSKFAARMLETLYPSD